MKPLLTPMSWDSPDVYRYEETISLKIPGYALLHDMADRLLAAQIGEEAEQPELLVVGAGGGQEMVTLGRKHEKWLLTGIDPSERMLDIAEGRVRAAALDSRVTLLHGTIDRIPQSHRYDGAACMLVLHFVESLSRKLELLQGIAERLKPWAPFVMASINGDPQSPSFRMQMNAWRQHMADNGIGPEGWERFAASIGRDSHPVPSQQVAALLREAGFTAATRFFGSYLVEGFFAVKDAGVK